MKLTKVIIATSLAGANAFAPQIAKSTYRHTQLYSAIDKNNDGGDEELGFFDEEEYRQIAREREAFQFIFDVDEDSKPDDVYIILFNPETPNEGVHTLEFPKGSGNNMILAFESKAECEEFSEMLKEQQFFDPVTQEMNLEGLEIYCGQIGVEVQVVPEGLKLKPPTETVDELDCNPNRDEEVKMLDYLFQISEECSVDVTAEGCFDVEETESAWE